MLINKEVVLIITRELLEILLTALCKNELSSCFNYRILQMKSTAITF